ncbi:MAG: hypothetical protein ACTSRB_09905 [Candidatus Helarchaeota archaeon]
MSDWNPNENMINSLEKSLKDILKEKMRHPKWREKIKKADLRLNLSLTDEKYDKSKIVGTIGIVFDPQKGTYEFSRGKIENPHLEMYAPLSKFFEFSSWQMSTLKSILGGLKISGKRRISKLLLTGALLRCLKEKDLKDLED